MVRLEETFRAIFSSPKYHRQPPEARTSLVPSWTRNSRNFRNISRSREPDNYDRAIDKLDAYFSPKKNIDYEIFQLRQTKQLTDETVDQFCLRLRKLAISCDFHDTEKEIKAAVIQNCLSKRLRRVALREDTLSLDQLLAKARALEPAKFKQPESKNLSLQRALRTVTLLRSIAHFRIVRRKVNRPQLQDRRLNHAVNVATLGHIKSPVLHKASSVRNVERITILLKFVAAVLHHANEDQTSLVLPNRSYIILKLNLQTTPARMTNTC